MITNYHFISKGTALNALSRFKSPYASGAAPAPKAAPAAKSVGKSAGKAVVARAPKKDMTWGGRPDPAPEAVIVVGEGLNAPWRLNQKKANEN